MNSGIYNAMLGYIFIPFQRESGEVFRADVQIVLMDTRTTAGCGAGHRAITLNPAGQVKICSMQPSAWFNLGHIMDIESDNGQERLRDFTQLPSPGIESCKECKHLPYCMNCYARAFNLLKTGTITPGQCSWYQQNAETLTRFDIC